LVDFRFYFFKFARHFFLSVIEYQKHKHINNCLDLYILTIFLLHLTWFRYWNRKSLPMPCNTR